MRIVGQMQAYHIVTEVGGGAVSIQMKIKLNAAKLESRGYLFPKSKTGCLGAH